MIGLFQEIFYGVWRIDKSFADSFLPVIKSLLDGNLSTQDFSEYRLQSTPRYATFQNEIYTVSDYGEYKSPEEAPADSIAILKVHGPITYYDQQCGGSGMSTKSNLLERMSNNPNINAIVLELRSGGGEGFASEKLVRSIKKVKKPVIAFVEDFAMSAAYEIASACDWIVTNSESAKIGSIGTYVTIVDYEQSLKNEGLRLIEVYADKSKDKNQDYYEAIKGNTDRIKADVNRWNDLFISEIKTNRGESLNPDEEIWGTGKTFFSPEALQIGLIDEIASFDETIQSLQNSFNS